jgi:signal transduction histidine kinase
VAAGLARSWRLDPSVVRFGFLALTLAAGVGVVVYGVLWALLPVDESPVDDDGVGSGIGESSREGRLEDLAALAVIAGALLVLRSAGIWLSDMAAVLGGIAIVGVVLVWGRAGSRDDLVRDQRAAVRIVVGVALVAVGFVALVARTGDLETLGRSLLAASAAAVGVALLVGPRLARLADDLASERRARVRSEERAEIAAHLHDGVLQTLALIQRRAGDNREVASLARRQERELREWLYGAPVPAGGSLHSALVAELASVEDDHQVPVELVCVGDVPLDEQIAALVAATREAATNAARHAGASRVDVYVEVEDDEVSAFVRDRGRGFEPSAVPPDRRGLADSVIGRVRRAGGTAEVRSRPGEGTEVRLHVPRRT